MSYLKNDITLMLTVSILFSGLIFPLPVNLTIAQQLNRSNQEIREGKWMIRFNQPAAQEKFIASTSSDGFTLKTRKCDPEADDIYVFYHLYLDKPVKGLSFDYSLTGSAELMPITLYDAAANELWRYDGKGKTPSKVKLKKLKAHGQVVFRIRRNRSAELPDDWSHIISNIILKEDKSKTVPDNDGFILVNDLNDFRGYVSRDDVKVRMKPGVYTLDKALFRSFIEVTGNNSTFDMKGVKFMVDTRLFSQFGAGGGDAGIYCVLKLSGDNIIMEGLNVETYGNQRGIQSRNKMFNITGMGVTLKNAEIRTEGSSPWGYGSLYGISGGDVRKMNGIRVGWPAKNVKLIGCRVHMRAMGHAIFVQGAENTLIEDCHVDGLLRTTEDILSEKSGYAFEKNFIARGRNYIEGVTVGEEGEIIPGEMISLSEDGIRMYPQSGNGQPTISTNVKNCSVTNMRRGICTGLSSSGDKVINCQVTNCVATGYNAGNADTLINCKADAKYSEALCLAYINASRAYVDLEILDSRGGRPDKMKKVILYYIFRIFFTISSLSLKTFTMYIPDN